VGVSLEIETVEDPARACSAMLVGALVGGDDVVVTGGSTPRQAYAHLASAVRDMDLDASEATLWFSDERCVGPDDEQSNFRLLKESLLDNLAGRPQPDVRRIHGELGPDEAAESYERELVEAGEPRFELVLLGLGPDTHIASMFPGHESLGERSRLALGVPEAGFEPYVPRVTLTLPVLANAERVVFLVTGEAKAEAVARAFGPDAKPDPGVPASMLVPMADEITVLLDPAAASLL
jgi:6-phosphogluconolactonase